MDLDFSQSHRDSTVVGQPRFSLRLLTQHRLLQDVVRAAIQNKVFRESTFYMVVDNQALAVIDSACEITDLHENKITLVEKLELSRKPYPEKDVIYLVSATGASIKKIIQDFSDAKVPQYGAVHLFFLSRVSPALFDLLSGCKELVRRIRNFREVNTNFLFHDSHTFLLSPPGMPAL